METPAGARVGVPGYLRSGGYGLRAFDRADTEHSAAWWPEPYPVNSPEANRWLEAALRERFGSRQTFAIVRLADGRLVGSVAILLWRELQAWLSLSVDPLLSVPVQVEVAQAVARIAVPWLLDDWGCLSVVIETPADRPIDPAAAELGLRRAGAYREAVARPTGRVDRVVWEGTNPAWAHAFAPSEPLPDRAPQRIDLAPGAPREALRNPVMIGPRVYLRPHEADDGAEIARWTADETETWFDLGRRPLSPMRLELLMPEMYKERPPSVIRFAVCRLADNRLIGDVGVEHLDWVNRSGETFSFFGGEARGQGLGTEAKMLLLAFCFERLNLHLITSAVFNFNHRSAAALLKQGYRLVGITRAPISRTGRFAEDWLFDLLAADWRRLMRDD